MTDTSIEDFIPFIEEMKNSDDPADRMFYIKIIRTLIEIGKRLAESRILDEEDKNQAKQIIEKLESKIQNYELYVSPQKEILAGSEE